MAFDLCRKKGRVVVLGDVGLALSREDFYKKEIDFLISTSYGPGRYDDAYEVYGEDYPYAFVRWTENRNMLLYLDLIASGSINIDFLIKNIVNIEDSEMAYESLKKPVSAVSLLFNHQLPNSSSIKTKIFTEAPNNISVKDKAVLGLIGAGSFCRGMHLPNIKKLDDIFHIYSIANRTGNKARSVADQYQAKYSTTSYKELLDDQQINAVIISTRHDTHAKIVCDSLEAGKHVFVEKPLALSPNELSEVIQTYQKQQNQVLMVGYNRRFSSAIQFVKSKISIRNSPIVINYNVNAGMISKDHWLNRSSGGGRNLGEACHMYDVFTYLTGSQYRSIEASSIGSDSGMYSWRDNFGVTITFEDGSLCNLIYTSMGGASQAKEEITIFSEGVSYFIDDYSKVFTYQNKSIKQNKFSGKGHLEELRSFGNSIKHGEKLPIPIWQLEQVSKISLIVEEKIQGLDDV
jgi:predicted dehydrogenase